MFIGDVNMIVFWTGFFTLVSSLGSIWMREYFERRKDSNRSEKQKAIEAYSLADKLLFSHNLREIVCSNLLSDSTYNSNNILSNREDTFFSDLEKLELIILENFFDLNSYFVELKSVLCAYAQFLLGIICNSKGHGVHPEFFEQNKKNYQASVIAASTNLKEKLNDIYINKKQPDINIYSCINLLKYSISAFFKKPGQNN